MKRIRAVAEAAARATRPSTPVDADCALCERPLGRRIEWHHPVPKSHGGTATVPVHPICHRTIHACITNRELASAFTDQAAVRGRDDIGRFLRWIADKPPDFHAPTRRSPAR